MAKFDPRELKSNKYKTFDVEGHNDLLAMLSESGVAKYSNLLLTMVRYVKSYIGVSPEKRARIESEVASDFNDDSFYAVDETDTLYLIERIILDNGEVYLDPIDVWSIDTRIMKAVLLRKMFHLEFDYKDMDCIRCKFNINKKIYFGVRLGGADATDKIELVNTVNKYLYEFYKRSTDPNEELLAHYSWRATSKNMSIAYNKKFGVEPFRYDLTMGTSIEQTLYNIDEYCNNLKYYAKRVYELSYFEDYFESSSGQGKSHYNEKFKTYEKCLQVYDRYKDMVPVGGSIDDYRFGVKIDKEEGTRSLSDRKRLDRRKDIRKHYKMALELIEQSTQGYLS